MTRRAQAAGRKPSPQAVRKSAPRAPKEKGLIRGLVHRAVRDEKAPRVVKHTGRLREPTVCERCGAVFRGKTWRAGQRSIRTSLVGAAWAVCPACRQVAEGEYFGRVVLQGPYPLEHESEIRRRIATVAARARYTQPERRVVSIDRTEDSIEILTTSQKLAHRIVRSIQKAYGGEAEFKWTEPHGELYAVWARAEAGAEPDSGPNRRRSARLTRRGTFDLEIQTRHIDLDPRWRDLIEQSAARLAGRFPRVIRMHVTLRHTLHHRRGIEEVAIVTNAPDGVIRVLKEKPRPLDALRAAFRALGRELDEQRGRRRRVVNRPRRRIQGSVMRIFPEDGYGFVLLPEGREAYFHRDALREADFQALQPGDPVEVQVEEGAGGLQALCVYPLGEPD